MAQYDVFISYSHFDTRAVNSLIAKLRHNIPDIRIWYDIEGADSWGVFISRPEEAIERSDMVIFVCSENSLAKEHCRKEVLYAKKIGKKVIPYLLPSMKLRGWLLYEFGTLNVIYASKEGDMIRMIKTIKSRIKANETLTHNKLGSEGADNSVVQTFVEGKDANNSEQQDSRRSSTPTSSSNSTLNEEKGNSNNSSPNSTAMPKALDAFSSHHSEEPLRYQSPVGSAYKQDSGALMANPVGIITGHTFVDLGLPSGVKWATCNIGARVPEEYGDYFAWSESETKTWYDPANCTSYKKDVVWLRGYGYIGSRQQLEMSHDVARHRWGGTWRLPSKKEIEELIQKTTWKWVELNGVYGYKIQSNINDNDIFIPAAGYKEGAKLFGSDERGLLWSGTANDGAVEISYALAFTSRNYFLGMYNRFLGFPVRPVTN